MWLPKYERKLLRYYYLKINKVETEQFFELKDLSKALGKKDTPKLQRTKRETILDTYNEAEKVNNLLSQRGLITWKNLDPASISVLQIFPKTSEDFSLPENTNINLRITLTIEGYDLGKKYNSWWTRTGLWFAEYKDHWFWLIISFLGGIIGALVVNWLSK